jgi:hypothetical protein
MKGTGTPNPWLTTIHKEPSLAKVDFTQNQLDHVKSVIIQQNSL